MRRLVLAHLQLPALQLLPIHLRDGRVGEFLIRELGDRKPPGPPGHVGLDVHVNGLEGEERLVELLARDLPGNVSHKNVDPPDVLDLGSIEAHVHRPPLQLGLVQLGHGQGCSFRRRVRRQAPAFGALRVRMALHRRVEDLADGAKELQELLVRRVPGEVANVDVGVLHGLSGASSLRRCRSAVLCYRPLAGGPAAVKSSGRGVRGPGRLRMN
mmetsp:Transcript_27220/g.85705  ORF Transcript_27220/g.85705 Transcript_27220/m.85705 type:complete len:213 (-) Transcript_27220:433-1071(-)